MRCFQYKGVSVYAIYLLTELQKLAPDARFTSTLNLKNPKIIGSGFLTDFQRYLRIYSSTNLFQKLLGSNPDNLNSASLKVKERANWLDDFFGADLVLMGVKN